MTIGGDLPFRGNPADPFSIPYGPAGQSFLYIHAGFRVRETTFTVAPVGTSSAAVQPIGQHTQTYVSPTAGFGFELPVGRLPIGAVTIGANYTHIFGSNQTTTIPVQAAPGVVAPITLPNTAQSGDEVKAGVKLYFDALGRNQVM